MTNYYKLLQVDPSADPEVIAAAYKRLALKNHPDTNGASAEAKARMQAINEAYEVLSDPVRRADYDRRLDAQPAVAENTFSAQPTGSEVPPPMADLLNVKSIGLLLIIAAIVLAVAVIGFKLGPLEIVIVLATAVLLVQPLRDWLKRRSRR
jgi:curved DNA-binding protein CbpA